MVIKRYKKWKLWRNYTYFNTFQQILVLFGLKHSLHFDQFLMN